MKDSRGSWSWPACSSLLLAFACAGCGGGGSGGSAGSIDSAFTSEPAAGAVDVDPEVRVRVQLPLPPGPVQPEWLRLWRDGEMVPGTLTRDGDALLFEPDARLHLLAEHTVTLAVPGSTNEGLEFTVRDGAWNVPMDGAEDLHVVDVAADADGGVWVCMLTLAEPLSRMVLVYVAGDGTIGPFTWFANDASVDDARIAVDRDGLAIVAAARQGIGDTYRVWTAVHAPGDESWGAFLPRSHASTVAPLIHACFVRPGEALVAWEIANTRDLWRARFDSGTGWSEPVAIEPADTAAEALDVAADGDGDVVAIWRTLPGDYLESSVLGGDGSERALRVFEPFDCCVGEPRVALAAGRALAVWRAEENLFASWLEGDAWTTAAPVALAGPGGLEGPLRVGLSDAGIGYVVWIAGGVLRGRRLESSGALGPTVVLAASETSPSSPVLSVDPAGNALCVWDQVASDESGRQVAAARALASGGWGFAQPLVPAAGECSVSPRLDGARDGGAWAGWTTTIGCDFTQGFGVSLSRFD